MNPLKHGLYSKDQAIRLFGGAVAEIEAITTSPAFLDPDRLAAVKARLPRVAEMIEDVKEA
jgi:hypothetical protein